jgi:hypothetical protein
MGIVSKDTSKVPQGCNRRLDMEAGEALVHVNSHILFIIVKNEQEQVPHS